MTHPGFPIRNPIDAFILARLNAAGLTPNPEADRRTLARRLSLDLTGLPPAPEEVEAFVQDGAPDYYERRVRSLLASPRWGEHRARYWLDVARYADTHGLHFDNYREMWPYRDRVIAAYFRNTTQSGFDGNVKDGANASLTVIDHPADRARWNELPDAIAAATRQRDRLRTEAETPFEPWALALTPDHFDRALRSGLALHAPVTDGHADVIAGSTAAHPTSFRATGQYRWDTAGHAGPALFFGKEGTVDLGDAGDFELGSGFSCGAWVFVPADFKDTAAIVARMDEANDHRGWDLWIQGDRFAAHFVHRWPDNALKVRTKRPAVRKGAWQHVLVTFDAPSRETCAVRRERTNTPLQALATLNDPQFLEAARVLAEKALLDADRQPDDALDRLARRILLRPLEPDELAAVSATLAAMQAFYRDQPVEAGKLIAVGDTPPDPAVSAPDLAAFTLVANQRLNLDDVLSK